MPYVHSKYYNADGTIVGNWIWKINFDLPAGMPTTGNAKLTIAYASADHAQQWIYINTGSGTPISYYPAIADGNAFLRQSNHAKYTTSVVNIPMSKLHSGSNYIQLVMPSNSGDVSHLMYDYISFEAITNTNNLAVSLKVMNTVEEIIAHPNPTTGIFEISSLPDSIHEVTIELYTLQMQLISKKHIL